MKWQTVTGTSGATYGADFYCSSYTPLDPKLCVGCTCHKKSIHTTYCPCAPAMRLRIYTRVETYSEKIADF